MRPAVRQPKVKDGLDRDLGLEAVLCDPLHFSDEKKLKLKEGTCPLKSHSWLVAEDRQRSRISDAPLYFSSLPHLHQPLFTSCGRKMSSKVSTLILSAEHIQFSITSNTMEWNRRSVGG